MRPIDADALIKEYEEIAKALADFCETERMMCREVIRALQNAPTIEPTEDVNKVQTSADRPKGEWIDREDSKPQPYVPEASTERVVHCKDCIYSSQPDGEELFVCGNVLGMSGWVREDEFCSSGSL